MITKLRGFGLIEILIAVFIVSFGVLAVGKLQTTVMTNSNENRARQIAMQLAQSRIEFVKEYSEQFVSGSVSSKSELLINIQTLLRSNQSANSILGLNSTLASDIAESQSIYNFTFSDSVSSVDRGLDYSIKVMWNDSSDYQQNIQLSTSIAFLAPGTGGDTSVPKNETYLDPPTGRAYLGEGKITDQVVQESLAARDDGTATYQDDDNLLLTVGEGEGSDVVLTLEDACEQVDGVNTTLCTDFVEIEGRVYFDNGFAGSGDFKASDVFVLASDAAFCTRYFDTTYFETDTVLNDDQYTRATIEFSSLPTSTSGYKYFNYRCYLGGGWHGNIGLVFTILENLGEFGPDNTQPTVCTGMPYPKNGDITLPKFPMSESTKRVYRGMAWAIDMAGSTRQKMADGTYLPEYEIINGEQVIDYYSWGIADATKLNYTNSNNKNHDFLVTSEAACDGQRGVSDSIFNAGHSEFNDNLGNFFCFNNRYQNAKGLAYDPDNGLKGQYIEFPLDGDERTHLDTRRFDKNQDGVYENEDNFGFYDSCPYDPSELIEFVHLVSGQVRITGDSSGGYINDISEELSILSSPLGDCGIGAITFDSGTDTYVASVLCRVYDSSDDAGENITYSIDNTSVGSSIDFDNCESRTLFVDGDRSDLSLSCILSLSFVAKNDFGGNFDLSSGYTGSMIFDVVNGLTPIPNPDANDSFMVADISGDNEVYLLEAVLTSGLGTVEIVTNADSGKIQYTPNVVDSQAEASDVQISYTIGNANSVGASTVTSSAKLTFKISDFGTASPMLALSDVSIDAYEGITYTLTSTILSAVSNGSGSETISSVTSLNGGGAYISLAGNELNFAIPLNQLSQPTDYEYSIGVTDGASTVEATLSVSAKPLDIYTITFSTDDVTSDATPSVGSVVPGANTSCSDAGNGANARHVCTIPSAGVWYGIVEIKADTTTRIRINGSNTNVPDTACPGELDFSVDGLSSDKNIVVNIKQGSATCP